MKIAVSTEYGSNIVCQDVVCYTGVGSNRAHIDQTPLELSV